MSNPIQTIRKDTSYFPTTAIGANNMERESLYQRMRKQSLNLGIHASPVDVPSNGHQSAAGDVPDEPRSEQSTWMMKWTKDKKKLRFFFECNHCQHKFWSYVAMWLICLGGRPLTLTCERCGVKHEFKYEEHEIQE